MAAAVAAGEVGDFSELAALALAVAGPALSVGMSSGRPRKPMASPQSNISNPIRGVAQDWIWMVTAFLLGSSMRLPFGGG